MVLIASLITRRSSPTARHEWTRRYGVEKGGFGARNGDLGAMNGDFGIEKGILGSGMEILG